MTTNKEWLFSLPLEEQYAWMNAEHVQQPVTDASERVTNQAEMLDDSRELLETDVRELMRNLYEIGYTDAKINHGILNDEVAAPLFSFDEKRGAKFIELLDRQAAITEREHPGLTISDDESLINWRGRNYLPQSKVLNAERERDEFSLKLKHEMKLNRDNRNAHDLEQIAELTAERDTLQGALDIAVQNESKLEAERDKLKADLDAVYAKNRALRQHIAQMQNGRNEWHVKAVRLKKQLEATEKQCELYREKFGKCLDYADAIHALMDDEGMA